MTQFPRKGPSFSLSEDNACIILFIYDIYFYRYTQNLNKMNFFFLSVAVNNPMFLKQTSNISNFISRAI